MESRIQGSKIKAKAKDTKNSRPRPMTALPRTDPLEAKANNQGHKAQVFPKQKKEKGQSNFRGLDASRPRPKT